MPCLVGFRHGFLYAVFGHHGVTVGQVAGGKSLQRRVSLGVKRVNAAGLKILECLFANVHYSFNLAAKLLLFLPKTNFLQKKQHFLLLILLPIAY